VHPATKWNDVNVDVDSDTAGGVVTVVEALLDRARSDVVTAALGRVASAVEPQRFATSVHI